MRERRTQEERGVKWCACVCATGTVMGKLTEMTSKEYIAVSKQGLL